jgi:hypothetical protein
MTTPAERFRLAPVSKDGASIAVDASEDHPGQWVLRRVGSNGYVSVDNQAFSIGNAFKSELVDDTLVQVWSKNHLVKTVARTRHRTGLQGPCRRATRQRSAEAPTSGISRNLTRGTANLSCPRAFTLMRASRLTNAGTPTGGRSGRVR